MTMNIIKGNFYVPYAWPSDIVTFAQDVHLRHLYTDVWYAELWNSVQILSTQNSQAVKKWCGLNKPG